MKVLIVKLSSIGDVIHTLPALASLRKGFERKGIRARIDWLVEEAASGVLENHPYIDNLIVVKRGWSAHFKENLKAAGRLSSERYDLVIDFQGLLKSGVWVFLSKGARRIGFSNARELSHIFLNEKLPPYDPDRHAVDRYLSLAASAGGSPGDARFVIGTGGLERKRAASILKDCGLKESEAFFALIPRARWATKLWGDDKFIELAKRVVERYGIKAALIGGASDKPALESMRRRIGPGAVNLAGLTGLKELYEILRLADFTVTVDSGPMHLAVAAGSRCIAIFGPTAPWRTGPYGEGHFIVRKGLPCSPCFKKRCPDLKCMDGVTAEEVMKAVESVVTRGI